MQLLFASQFPAVVTAALKVAYKIKVLVFDPKIPKNHLLLQYIHSNALYRRLKRYLRTRSMHEKHAKERSFSLFGRRRGLRSCFQILRSKST